MRRCTWRAPGNDNEEERDNNSADATLITCLHYSCMPAVPQSTHGSYPLLRKQGDKGLAERSAPPKPRGTQAPELDFEPRDCGC